MRHETELERLAAARPAILDRTYEVVTATEQEQMLRQILADPRGDHPAPRAADERTLARKRGHRISLRTSVAAASVAAVVLAGAALAIDDGRQPAATTGTPGGPAVTADAKIVLARSIGALDQIGDAVEYSHVTGSLNGRSYSSDRWVHRAMERQRLTGPGSTDTEGWQAITGGTLTKGFIYYNGKTWTQYSNPADPAWLEVSRTPTARLEAGFLKSALDSGRWTVTGRAVLDGQEAMVIQVTEIFPGQPVPVPNASRRPGRTRAPGDSPAIPAGPLIDVAPSLTPAQYAQARSHGQTTFTSTGTVTRTLYISATTYLPIEETDVTHLSSQGVPGSAADQTESSTFQWLPVTPANLALLRPPAVPAGYTRVSPNGQ